ncbi:MAG: 2-oxoacid:acceptor oxidoreductase family protein [Dissulfurispiraceae bacterium]|jgi:2-oxoglutarate ferredoxin oxidoreductase subunit gamma
MERRTIIAGSGGQGILFLGKLIAYAAMREKKEVTWFPAYGAEIRGGTASCTVIVSTDMIGSPIVENTDFLIVMNEASYAKFQGRIVPGGTLIYDSSSIKAPAHRSDIISIPVPASDMAASMKNKGLANMVLIGAFSAISGLISLEALNNVLVDIMSTRRKNLLSLNKEIILKGYTLAKDSESVSS